MRDGVLDGRHGRISKKLFSSLFLPQLIFGSAGK
jgi:hypothetical protein